MTTSAPQNDDATNLTSAPSGLRYTTRLAAAGLLLSLALEYVHVTTYLKPTEGSFCSVGEAFDCVAVAASASSIFLGVPWAIWGIIGFVAITIASLLRSQWLLPLSLAAAGASLLLLGTSLIQVGSLCYLCEAVHLVSWILAALVWRGRGALSGTYTSSTAINSIFGTTLALVVAAYLIVPPYWGSFNYRAEPPFPTGTTDEGYSWIGAESPEKTIHEFVDYGCPHCKIASARTLRELARHSEWRIVRRHQPRMRCKKTMGWACRGVRMAICAKDHGKYWRADRWLFAHANPREVPDPSAMARDLDIPEGELLKCVEAESTFEQADSLAKEASRIIDVPTYVVDGKKLKSEEVKALFD